MAPGDQPTGFYQGYWHSRQRLTAIRKLALADNNIIDYATAQAVCRVAGARREGKRLGNWLTKAQAQRLLELPNVETPAPSLHLWTTR